MQARYFPWAVAGGACATLAPGTALWIAPLVGAMAHMVYDADPEGWHEAGRKLLTTAKRAELPDRRSSPPVKPNPKTEPKIEPQSKKAKGLPAQAGEKLEADAPLPSHPNKDPLFAALEERPHQLLIGHTGGGKTTMLHALATDWASAGERVMVCDPDASPGQYPGCRVVGGGDDYAAIAQVLELTQREVTKRRKLRAEGQREFQPLHLVVDEVQDVIAEVPETWEVLEPIIRRGRKIGVFLALGVQDKAVKTLKLEGQSVLLNNLAIADLELDSSGQRVARFGKGKEARALTVPKLRDPETLIVEKPKVQPVQQPQPKAEPLPADDPLLAGLLASAPPKEPSSASVTVHREPGGIVIVNASASAEQPAQRTPQPRRTRQRGSRVNVRRMRQRAASQQKAQTLDEIYAQLRAAGVPSFRQAYAQAGGDRSKALEAWRKAKP